MKKVCLPVLVFILLLFGACSSPGEVEEIQSEPENTAENSNNSASNLVVSAITADSGNYRYTDPALAFDGTGTLHLIYQDKTSDNYQDYFVAHRHLLADGNWSETVDITPSDLVDIGAGSVGLYLLPNPSGNVCAFFDATSDEGQGLHMRCLNNGEWSTPSMVIHSISTSKPTFAPDGTVHAVTGNNSASYNGGINLSSSELSVGFEGAIFVDQAGAYHALWHGLDDPSGLRYRNSEDGGQTWSEVETLADRADATAVMVDQQGNAHLLSASSDRLYFHWTPEGGWEEPIDLGCCAGTANMALDANGFVHAVWSNASYIYQQSDGSWSEPFIIGENIRLPVIAIDGQGTRHFVWEGGGDDNNLYYATLP